MDLNHIKTYYPLNQTIIGYFCTDQNFEATTIDDIKNIENWEYPPLESTDSYFFPFIYFNSQSSIFECWGFASFPVSYYLIDQDDQCKLVTYSTDLGYETYDPDEDRYDNYYDRPYIISPFYPQSFKTRENYILSLFNNDAYKQGHLFTTYEQLRNFIKQRNDEK